MPAGVIWSILPSLSQSIFWKIKFLLLIIEVGKLGGSIYDEGDASLQCYNMYRIVKIYVQQNIVEKIAILLYDYN